MNKEVSKYLSEIGKKGGSAKTPKKNAASIENGKKGGRPPLTLNYFHDGIDISPDNKEILSKFTKGLFWSFNMELLHYQHNKELIIERVLDAGLDNDETLMWNLYSYNDIKKVALKMNNLHTDKLPYFAFVLKVNKEEFKCYGKKPWFRKTNDDVGKLLFAPEEEDGIKYLSLKEIAPMKLNAASDRGKGRDFIDIAFLLQEFTLSEMFDLYKKKYGNINLNILKRNLLIKIDKVKEDEWLTDIKMLRNDILIKDIPLIIKNAITDYNESIGIKKDKDIIKDKDGNKVNILKKELLTIRKKIKIYKLKCKDINFNDIYILQYKENKTTINHFFKNDFTYDEVSKYLEKSN